jgi:putative transcriptional regulator
MAKKKKKKEILIEINPGTLLMAQPFWDDEKYNRAVILITEVEENEVKGLIINKTSFVKVNEVFSEINTSDAVMYGGPLNDRAISFLHTQPDMGGDDMSNDLYFGGETEVLMEKLKASSEHFVPILFLCGNVAWTKDLLEEEIKQNKWWVSTLTSKELFNTPAETLWSYKVLQSGHTYGLFAHLPDPALNEKVAEGFNIN